MKRIIFLAIMCATFGICYAQESASTGTNQSAPKETVTFDKVDHDFGVVSESGGAVEYEFTFKNTGTTPIVITRVQPSCGCTTTDYTKEPVAPGKKGFIKASFNPRGTKNVFTKTVTVHTSGNPERVTLTIKGDVK